MSIGGGNAGGFGPTDADDDSLNTETAQSGDNSITTFHGSSEQKVDSTSYLDSMDDGNSITYLSDTPDQMASLVTAQAMDTLLGAARTWQSGILHCRRYRPSGNRCNHGFLSTRPQRRRHCAYQNNGIHSLPGSPNVVTSRSDFNHYFSRSDSR